MAHTKLTLQDVARLAADKNGGKGGRALQREAEKRGLTLSYATVDRILAGKYESKPQRPTIEALAALSGLPRDRVYEAAGLPLPMAPFSEQVPEGADRLTVDQRRVVLDVIRGFVRDNDRMADLEKQLDQQHEPAPTRPVDVEDPAQPDGSTSAGASDTDIGAKVHHLDRSDTKADSYPWEQPDFDLAAKRGRNRGREAREQQDRDAEDGGA